MAVSEMSCGLCGADKAAHEELNHEYSLEGALIPKKKKPSPIPRQGIAGDTVMIRLIGVLAERGVLTEKDLGKIFPAGEGSNAGGN